ncbi:MAG TPA: M17 family peptidase N-terminal domain-containing protein, partial [Microthrixaceae bacterium]|nr:M17 family peptidase N-terminal domain-containing protein [Microthrixaceae bacterium]
MISVKLAKKAPATASIVGELVAAEQLGGRGLDKRQLGRLGFKAEAGQVTSLAGKGETIRVLVGVGKESALDRHGLRRAAAAFAKAVCDQRSAVLTVGSRLGGVDRAAAIQALTEGLAYGGYRFDEYKSKPGTHLGSVTLVGTGDESEAAGLARGKAIAGAVCWARDLLNEPGGTLTAPEFADRVAARGTEAGVEVQVLGKRQIEAERMGGLLAVNQGSTLEPRFVTMTYAPEGATASIALVGKGITFDSGGLSIKPAEAMMTMKNDMGGAAAVVAA